MSARFANERQRGTRGGQSARRKQVPARVRFDQIRSTLTTP